MVLRIKPSTARGKKFMVVYRGRKIHFGARGYGDFDLWRRRRGMKFALAKRRRYVRSHTKILMGDGSLAWKDRTSPEYYSMRALWDFPRGNKLFKQVVRFRGSK